MENFKGMSFQMHVNNLRKMLFRTHVRNPRRMPPEYMNINNKSIEILRGLNLYCPFKDDKNDDIISNT